MSERNYEPDSRFAQLLDDSDPFAKYRSRFHVPYGADGESLIYLCGNSLGLQPKALPDLLDEELDDWRRLAVKGHFQARRPWMPYHEQLTAASAAMVGAMPVEVVNMNSLTVNLHLMMVSFYRPTEERHKLLIEKPAFPSDRYAAESQIKYHGFKAKESLLEIAPREGESTIRPEDLLELIEREGDSIALILLPGVQYYSGQAFDMKTITELGHAKGCKVGFDLAHAVG